jgi:hypothetical protein
VVKRALAEGPTGSGCGEAEITNAAAWGRTTWRERHLQLPCLAM